MSFLEDDFLDTFFKKGLKRGSRWNFWKRKNSRNVQEKYCEKLGNFQVGLTWRFFKKKLINRNFWSKKRVFWVYLGHFLDFGPEKKFGTWTCIIWDTFCWRSFSVGWVPWKMTCNHRQSIETNEGKEDLSIYHIDRIFIYLCHPYR